MPDQLAPDHEAPDHEAPDHEAPDHEAPDQLAPDHEAPDHEAPDQLAPDHEAPDQLAPDHEAPDHEAPDQWPPDQVAPVGATMPVPWPAARACVGAGVLYCGLFHDLPPWTTPLPIVWTGTGLRRVMDPTSNVALRPAGVNAG